MRNLGPLTFLSVLCLFATQQAQAQRPDQVPPPMPPVIEWEPETAKLPATNYAPPVGKAEPWPGATHQTQGTRRADLATQERCAEAPVDVTATSEDERRLACSAASHALHLLGSCDISARRPIRIEIIREVRHPFSGPIFGLFDTKLETVLLAEYASIPALVRDTPYSELPQRDFYNSLIVHEVVHGVLHQNYKRKPMSHAAYEYPAYALQIESLSSNVRDQFLQATKKGNDRPDFLFSDSLLLFDPFFFAASAYQHFKEAPDGCTYLHALLQGDVAFILALPSSF